MVTHTRSGFVAPKETTLLQTPASLLQDEVLTLFAPLRKKSLYAEATETWCRSHREGTVTNC